MNNEKFEPEHRNASRPGLLSDGTGESDQISCLTTFRNDFAWPKYHQGPYARRKKLLRRFLFNEIADKYIKEMSAEDSARVMEKKSIYQETFKGDGFDIRDILESADPQVLAKYPLYTDQAHSVYFDKIKNIKQKTVSNDPHAVFRKYSYFSKPFYGELEE